MTEADEARIRISLYGALRSFAPGAEIELSAAPQLTAEQLKERLIAQLRELDVPGFKAELIRVSAVSTAENIIADDAEIGAVCELALLPPVCGG